MRAPICSASAAPLCVQFLLAIMPFTRLAGSGRKGSSGSGARSTAASSSAPDFEENELGELIGVHKASSSVYKAPSSSSPVLDSQPLTIHSSGSEEEVQEVDAHAGQSAAPAAASAAAAPSAQADYDEGATETERHMPTRHDENVG